MRSRFNWPAGWIAAVAFCLAGCASIPSPAGRVAAASDLAAVAGLQPEVTSTTPPLRAWSRAGSAGAPLVVYIEGDGLAWIDRRTPSSDPTPVNPVALKLATRDPAPNVLYLARPGQYLPGTAPQGYWLGARFAPAVVDLYEQVIRARAQATHAPAIHLVGYSGGAAIAALVAARLAQAEPARALTLRTVAGNLDHATWARLKKLTPLAASLNPADVAAQLADVPQLHLVGTHDTQVPPAVLEAFLAREGTRRCVQVRTAALPHAGPWDTEWDEVLATLPACAP